MLSSGLASCTFSTFYLCPDVCACAPFVPRLLVLCHRDSLLALLLMDHLRVCKNNCFAYRLAPDSVIFAVMEKEMQSVNLICTEA